VTTGTGKIELEIPRDRAGSFDPALIAKYQRRFDLTPVAHPTATGIAG
jgi:transposase-like protein